MHKKISAFVCMFFFLSLESMIPSLMAHVLSGAHFRNCSQASIQAARKQLPARHAELQKRKEALEKLSQTHPKNSQFLSALADVIAQLRETEAQLRQIPS